MHETLPTVRIGSGHQKGGRFFGGLSTNERRRSIRRRFILCAEHVRQLGGESPLDNLMEVKS